MKLSIRATLIAGASLLVILILGPTVAPYLGSLHPSSKNRGLEIVLASEFFDALYSKLGLEYTSTPFIEWILLTIPGAGAFEPEKIELLNGDIKIIFNETVLSRADGSSDRSLMPTLNILLLDYENNLSMNLLITSYTVARLSGVTVDQYEAFTNYSDLLLQKSRVVIDGSSLPALLETKSIIIKQIPNIPDIYEILGIEKPSFSKDPRSLARRLIDGIYYEVDSNIVNWMGTAAPGWWRARYVEADNDPSTNADTYWYKLVKYFYASTYYIDYNEYENLADGLQALTYYLLNENVRYNPEIGLHAIEPLEGFVGLDRWNNSLTGMAGWIDIGDTAKYLRVKLRQISVNPSPTYIESDYNSIIFNIIANFLQGSVSVNGEMLFGYYITGQSVANLEAGIRGPVGFLANGENKTYYIYVNFSSISYGPDYLIVWWKVEGTSCSGDCWVVRPVTLIVPLFMVGINTTTTIISDDPNLSTWEYPAVTLSNYYYINKKIIDNNVNVTDIVFNMSVIAIGHNSTSTYYDAILDLPLPASITLAMVGFIPDIPASYAIILNMISVLSSIGIVDTSSDLQFLNIMYFGQIANVPDNRYSIIVAVKYTKSAEELYEAASHPYPEGVFPWKIVVYINAVDSALPPSPPLSPPGPGPVPVPEENG